MNVHLKNNLDLKNYITKSIPFVLIIYTIIVATLSLVTMPNTDEIELPSFFDKIVHFCFYFGMSILVLSTRWIKYKKIRAASCIKTFTITLLFGFVIEIIQPYFGRTFDIGDIVANCCGNITGIALMVAVYRHFNIFANSKE